MYSRRHYDATPCGEAGLPLRRIPIHTSVKGALAQTEDWWTLVVNTDTGEKLVEHDWSHGNPYKAKSESSGTETVSVEDFLKGDNNVEAQLKLKSLLEELD
jgi:hypothetical protein